MTDEHSIWLMPSRSDEIWFSETVRCLAKQFSTPPFQPHLTLVEDMPRSSAVLIPAIEQMAAGISEIHIKIEGISSSELYYRSLYAAFSKVQALLTLKQRSIALLGKGDLNSFMPHVSLAYGVGAGQAKVDAIIDVAKRMSGKMVVFDRVAVVRSSQNIPIAEWKIVADVALAWH